MTPNPSAGTGPGVDQVGEVRIGISSCLLGEEVRFDGGHKRDPFLIHTVGPLVEWVPVCPEVEAGLGVPREAVRLVGPPERPRLVGSRSGTDHTERMAETVAHLAEMLAAARLDGFVLKKASPTCGLHRVRVYPEGDGPPNRDGRGLFAGGLVERLPLLPVEEEGRLNDPVLRENFCEAAFAHHRWRRFREESPTPAGLVQFHTDHKMTLLAHNPDGYRRVGRVAAQAGSGPLGEVLDTYAAEFMAVLRLPATRGRHVNVLHHLVGFVKDRLDQHDKSELLAAIDDYRAGLLPLIVPVTLLRHHLFRGDTPDWARRQTYLSPYPKELLLRNHV